MESLTEAAALHKNSSTDNSAATAQEVESFTSFSSRKRVRVSCRICGCTELDSNEARGELVCCRCGAVLEDTTLVDSLQFTESATGSVSMVGQFVPTCGGVSRGLRSSLGGDSRDAALQRGFNNIQSIAERLRLTSQQHLSSAVRLYLMASQRNFTVGRKSLLVASACLYAICRRERTPHLLIDFCDVLRTNVRALGQVFMKLLRVVHLQVPHVDPSLFLERFAYQMKLGDKTLAVAQTGVRLIQAMTRDWISTGRRPTGLCGAALLIAARYHNIQVNAEDVAQVVRVSSPTVNKRLQEFRLTATAQLPASKFEETDLLSLPAAAQPPCCRLRDKRKPKLAALPAAPQQLESTTAALLTASPTSDDASSPPPPRTIAPPLPPPLPPPASKLPQLPAPAAALPTLLSAPQLPLEVPSTTPVVIAAATDASAAAGAGGAGAAISAKFSSSGATALSTPSPQQISAVFVPDCAPPLLAATAAAAAVETAANGLNTPLHAAANNGEKGVCEKKGTDACTSGLSATAACCCTPLQGKRANQLLESGLNSTSSAGWAGAKIVGTGGGAVGETQPTSVEERGAFFVPLADSAVVHAGDFFAEEKTAESDVVSSSRTRAPSQLGGGSVGVVVDLQVESQILCKACPSPADILSLAGKMVTAIHSSPVAAAAVMTTNPLKKTHSAQVEAVFSNTEAFTQSAQQGASKASKTNLAGASSAVFEPDPLTELLRGVHTRVDDLLFDDYSTTAAVPESFAANKNSEGASSASNSIDVERKQQIILQEPTTTTIASISGTSFDAASAGDNILKEEKQEIIEENDEEEEEELRNLLLTESEKKAKALIWDELTKDVMPVVHRRLKEKRTREKNQSKRKEQPCTGGRGGRYGQYIEPVHEVATAADSVRLALQRSSRSIVKKINHNVLDSLFTFPSFSKDATAPLATAISPKAPLSPFL